jgi:hypothetical protein
MTDTDTDTDMAAALQRHALERIPSGQRGNAQSWCNGNAALLRDICDRGFSWSEVADLLTKVGLTLDNGGIISAESARKLVRRAGVPSARHRGKRALAGSSGWRQLLTPSASAVGAASDAFAVIVQPESLVAGAGVEVQPGHDASSASAFEPGQQDGRGSWQCPVSLVDEARRPAWKRGPYQEHDPKVSAVPPTARTRDQVHAGPDARSAGRHDVAELVTKRSELAEKGG